MNGKVTKKKHGHGVKICFKKEINKSCPSRKKNVQGIKNVVKITMVQKFSYVVEIYKILTVVKAVE